MREIKVRGYAVEEMVGSQWIHGFGVFEIKFAEHYSKEVGRSSDWCIYTESGNYLVDPKSVGQYTGLKDENGKEIYEGDIVKGKRSSHWHEGYNLVESPVVFDTEYAMFAASGSLGTIEEIEVIGNIYENSELLVNNWVKISISFRESV